MLRWSPTKRESRAVIDAFATVVMLSVAAVALWRVIPAKHTAKHPQGVRLSVDQLPLAGLKILGSPAAPVGVVEFADFYCPFCAEFVRSVLPQIKAQYIDTGLVRFDLRNFPLPIHALANNAAIAAECAARMGRFGQVHDFLFHAYPDVSTAGLESIARSIGVDSQKFLACAQDPAQSALLDDDLNLATRLGITATPTFVIGRVDGSALQVTAAVSGTGTFDDFAQLIETAKASLR